MRRKFWPGSDLDRVKRPREASSAWCFYISLQTSDKLPDFLLVPFLKRVVSGVQKVTEFVTLSTPGS